MYVGYDIRLGLKLYYLYSLFSSLLPCYLDTSIHHFSLQCSSMKEEAGVVMIYLVDLLQHDFLIPV